jgi:hypothetical protein
VVPGGYGGGTRDVEELVEKAKARESCKADSLWE